MAEQDGKICARCQAWKPFTDFYRERRMKDGRQGYCKTCKSVTTKYWFAENPEKARQFREKLWNRYATGRRQAWNRGLDWGLSFDDFKVLQRGVCTYCGGALPKTGIGLDRMDNMEGYFAWNVLPCCSICNLMRGSAFSVEETLQLGKVVRKIRYDREREKLH